MKPRLKSTRAARDMIKAHEPFVGKAELRGRRWVVGFGHTAAAKEGVRISHEDAELLLVYDLLQAEQSVEASVGADLVAPIRDALVSFAASVGANAFKVSDVARLARAGKHREAAAALETWVRAEEDGRLVVSERLTRRRAAEKALYLQGLEVAEPVAEPALQDDVPDPAQEPTIGMLVELDIAFEDPDGDNAEEAPAEVDATPAIASDVETLEAPPAEAPIEEPPTEESNVDQAASVSQPIELASEDEQHADASDEVETADAAQDGDEPEANAIKASQDLAIQAVMARMASDLAGSVHPRPDVEGAKPPQLGFSFLQTTIAEVHSVSEEIAPEPNAEEAADKPSSDAPAALAPVYATVSVKPAAQTEPAPPHPAEAPASAPGLSGEIDGPDHDASDEADAVEDEDELHPEVVAGPEAGLQDAGPEPVQREGGGFMLAANLAVGLVLLSLGAWELLSHFDAYIEYGFSYGWLGPMVFGSGVLLSVASGWLLVSRRLARRQR